MSVRSWPTAFGREPTGEQPARSEPGQGCIEGTWRDVRTDREEKEKEKINALFKTRIHLMNTLTEKKEWIQEAICAGETVDGIKTKKEHYDECWIEFVSKHEQYMELLISEEEKDIASRSYKELMTKKMHLDEMVMSLRKRTMLVSNQRGEDASSFSGKSRRSLASKSSHSSKSSTVSKRKEQLALAQLKRNQLLKQQELKRRMTELNFEKEYMEAQMEEERAIVSLNVYEKESGSNSEHEIVNGNTLSLNQQGQELSPLSQPFVPQEQILQGTNISSPKVPETYSPKGQVEQCNTPLQPTQTYIQQEQPVQSPNIPLAQTPRTYSPEGKVQQPAVKEVDTGEQMVRALRQVVSMPKIKYMHFDGDAINYASFMHNFETCLEKDNPDNSTRLQLLIQHCNNRARDAIESCVNLPAEEGYTTAKKTLYENFGKPHIIARAHINKLQNLPPLKQANGASLMEFSRHLEVADRTLTSMGPEYESELNHINTLRELTRKLPLFLRVKWTERAGTTIESGSRPKFKDFLHFVKKRATLVNNEFGEDLCASLVKPKEDVRRNDRSREPFRRSSLFTSGVDNRRSDKGGNADSLRCAMCSGNHRIWRCEKFKKLSYQERKKVVQQRELCLKCLSEGHYARKCPKIHFKCLVEGCSKGHNTLLHPPQTGAAVEEVKKEDQKPPGSIGETIEQEVKITGATGAGERVCLSVVPLKVRAKGSNQPAIEAYALLDSGSEVTLCHERLKTQLEASGRRLDFTLQGMTGSAKVRSELIDIEVASLDGETLIELSNVRTVNQMPISEACIARRGDVRSWSHLRDLPLQELETREVMLVIGLQENPSMFLPLEYRSGEYRDPVAIRYSLGWTVIGPVGEKRDGMCATSNFTRMSVNADDLSNEDRTFESLKKTREFLARTRATEESEHVKKDITGEVKEVESLDIHREGTDEDLKHQLERLWKTDFEGSLVETKVCPSVEDKKALQIMEKTLKIVDGHFQVALPWRNNPPYLPNNKMIAERRGLLLKKRLLRDDELLRKYRTTLNEYLEKGYAEKISKEQLEMENRLIWYLPHHPVTHPLKPEKVRVVYDCAASYGRTSLNQQLLQGPDQTNQLTGVLIRFREESVAMVADVEAMFHQVLVEPRDCDALRFLWWPSEDLSGEMEEYRMTRHLFGATSSPSVANFCLRKTAELHQDEFNPVAIETVKRNMYVDDLMKSAKETSEAIGLVSQLRHLLERGGFRLTKWYSNSREVMKTIPETERAKSVKDLELDRLPTESALGIKWNTEEDKFVWDVSEKMLQLVNEVSVTRRAIVSAVYSLFDPLGFIAPYVMKAKLLLQMLCRKGVGWDDPLQENEKAQWKRWLADLPKLQAIRVDRCFKPVGFGVVKKIQLHLFSDASRLGYSAVAYLRLEDTNEQIHCAFVIGKARLAPLREISIPRLELTAAVISVRLSKIIQEELDLEIARIYYWTDSMSVLKCINNESKRFHTFESNRLTVIRSGSDPSQWMYVNRDVNPADDGSKGVKLDAMISNNRWLNGPEFLLKDETHWPTMIQVPILKSDDPEVRKEAQIYATTVRCNVLETLIAHHSSWWKLKCSVAWLLRCKECLRAKVKLKKGSVVVDTEVETTANVGRLTIEELKVAQDEILRHVQLTAFPEELKILTVAGRAKKPDKVFLRKTGMSLRQLNPQLEGGLLRVGGRLVNAPIDGNSRHPIILPCRHPVTEMVIRHYHAEVGHMGQESVLSSLRKEFWIVKGRTAVRRVVRSCISCQRRKARLGEQFMANLPQSRLTPHQPPFTRVGVDYFGPLQVKRGRSVVKRYGCLFTCMTTRAVHIEIAHSLDTDSMVNALRRFISIRGCPEEIKSDNGTNFVSADKELNRSIEEWNQTKFHNFCAQRSIKWEFNPPSASHMGGVWERLIRSTRQVLRAILKEQLVSDEVLQTVMAEATQILNSRPLTRNSDSPMDEDPLTPNHLLHLRPTTSLPPGVFDKDDLSCKKSWRQAQYLTNVFWRRWIREYLPSLMERKKWNIPRRNLKIGDLVLIADENYPRGQWPLALVTEVIPSKDGYVRTVKVKTSSTVATRAKHRRRGENKINTTILTRPVAKLCLLEMDGE